MILNQKIIKLVFTNEAKFPALMSSLQMNFSKHQLIIAINYVSFIDKNTAFKFSFSMQMTDTQKSEMDVQVNDVLKLVEDFSRLH